MRLDRLLRLTNIKAEHALICLGIGASSGFVAGWANFSYIGFVSPLFFVDQTVITIIAITIMAPFLEEQVKPLGLYLLKEEENISLSLMNWALLGLLSGLGFGLLENVFYAIQAAEFGLDVALLLFSLRMLLSVPIHMISTMITGFGVGVWEKRDRGIYFILYLAIAMVIHGLYNGVAILLG